MTDSSTYSKTRGLKPVEELLYEDLDRVLVYIFEGSRAIKTISYLHDMGIEDSHIIVVGEDYTRGSKLFDAYDCQLGLCWTSKLQGFEIFEKDSYSETPYTIVTLGGSTTDPYLVNIISWSEYLFYYLCEMNINVRVICGGVGAFTVTQELNKLIRDVIDLAPDLVISYSGVNDLLRNTYLVEGHPFTNKYQKDFIGRCIQKRMLANELQTNFEAITKLTMGPIYNKTRWQYWIECERKMHGVCQEFGIEFIGCLQPYANEKYEAFMKQEGRRSNSFLYEETKKYILGSDWEWLIDLTDIFNNQTDVFFDDVHVYEKGNRLIARKIMAYVLPIIQRGKEN